MLSHDLRHAVADLVSLVNSRLGPVFRKSQLKIECRHRRSVHNHYREPLPRRELRVDSRESRGRGCHGILGENIGVIEACIADRKFVERSGAEGMVPCIGILLPVLFVLIAEAGQGRPEEGEVLYGGKPFPEGVAPDRVLGVKGVVDPQKKLVVCASDNRVKFEESAGPCGWYEAQKGL